MEDDVLKKFRREQKKREFKEKVHSKIQNGKDWCYENKDLIVQLAPAAIGVLAIGTKAIGKHANLKKQEAVKDLYCYDRSLGHYWNLKRKLTSKEWVTINNRKKNGERLGDILDSMKVLK